MSEDNEDENMVYMRQLKVPINFSVRQGLILRDFDLMPAISDVNFINEIKDYANYNDYGYEIGFTSEKEEEEKEEEKEEVNMNTLIQQANSNERMDDYCMLSLILFNKSNNSFDIDFYVRNDDNGNCFIYFFSIIYIYLYLK